MSYEQAAVYRRRAAHLRSLAAQLGSTPSLSLHLHAGVDTWFGPRADACLDDLACAQRAVHHAVDDLRTQAVAFDRHADELAAAAARAQRLLEVEGRARDLVRLVQQARRDADLDVSDRIELTITATDAWLDAVVTHGDLIAGETLATSLNTVRLDGDATAEPQISVAVAR